MLFFTRVFLTDVSETDGWIQRFRDFISGFKDFLNGLKDLVQVIFPFFTIEEIAFVISFLLIFFGLLIYLLVRKVTI